MKDLNELRYPVGKFSLPEHITDQSKKEWVDTIRAFAPSLQQTLLGVPPDRLQWRYRPEGWTVTQVVHHCADSHMNSFIRLKLALTEENPTIRPYDEKGWAQTPDNEAPLDWSLSILDGLHLKWVYLLEQLSDAEWARTFLHPATNRTFTLEQMTALYAWHSRHHLAHVHQALASGGSYQG